VRRSARRVHDAIRDLFGPDVPRVDVVGHSLGGLVATYLLKAIDRGKRVRRVVTLGAPHRGTPLALLGALPLGVFSRAVWQMLPGSPLLKEMERLPVPEGSDLFALEADADALVPLSFGRPPPAPRQANAVLAGIGHVDLLFSRCALDAVRTLLA
jgi:pimeloyl-ACP methyl ester carboxylesterase